MARIARLVVPGYPHHVTQRGNRRQRTFFCEDDYLEYITRLVDARDKAGVSVWAWCLMPNHVHLVVVPERHDSLAMFFAQAHLRYTRYINARNDWCGHLWQARFHSCVMDERHLIAGVRYVERNPVAAGLCDRPEEWPWSSARAHLTGADDALTTVRPMLERIEDWQAYLRAAGTDEELESLRTNSRTGRPLGDERFVEELEQLTGRALKRRKPGPK